MLTHNSYSLPSGIKVITIPLPVESLTTLALVNTGSRYEKPEQEGIAHFFEHVVFKGTKNYPSQSDLATTLDSVGAEYNAFTSKEYTGFYIKAASSYVKLSLDVLTDMLFTSVLKEGDIEREKGVIIEELNMYRDMPASYVGDLFDNLTYAGTSLAHDITGNKKTIKSFTCNDFRVFLREWYQPHNIQFVFAGNKKTLEKMNVKELLEKTVTEKNQQKNRKSIDTSPFLVDNPLSKKRILIKERACEQAHLILGWPGLKRSSKRRYSLMVLSMLLGGNMSSRLFEEVRNKRGLCYYVHSLVDQHHDGGIIGAAAGVDSNRVDEAITVIMDEFFALANTKKPTSKEVEKAKESIIGRMILSFEDTKNVAQFFGLRQLLLGKAESPEIIIKKIKQVSTADIIHLAEELFQHGETRLALIGPYKNKEKFDTLLSK